MTSSCQNGIDRGTHFFQESEGMPRRGRETFLTKLVNDAQTELKVGLLETPKRNCNRHCFAKTFQEKSRIRRTREKQKS